MCEETDILEDIIPRMFKVIQKVAEYSCKYVRHGRPGRRSPFLILHVLMIAARTVRGLVNPGTIEEMERSLAKAIKDFDFGVDVEGL